MLQRRRVLQRPRHQQQIARRIAQQLRRNFAGEGFVVHCTVRRSGDEKIICEILHRRDDGAGSRFPFDPANFSPLAKRSEKPFFLFDVEGPRVHDLQIGAAMAGKALSLGKHTGKCR